MSKWEKIKRCYYYIMLVLMMAIAFLSLFGQYTMNKIDILFFAVTGAYGIVSLISEIEENDNES